MTEFKYLKLEESFKFLFSSRPEPMLIIDSDEGQIVEANDAALSFYGYSYKELIGKKIADVNLYSKEAVKAEVELAKLEKRNYFRFTHQLSNGGLVAVNVTSYPLEISRKVYLISTITERMNFEIDSTNVLNNTLELSPDAFCIVDDENADFEILYINKAFCQVVDLDKDALEGKSLIEIVTNLDGNLFEMNRKHGGTYIVRLVNDGLHIRLNCVKVRYEGRTLSLLQLLPMKYRLVADLVYDQILENSVNEFYNGEQGCLIGVQLFTNSASDNLLESYQDLIYDSLHSVFKKMTVYLSKKSNILIYANISIDKVYEALNKFIQKIDVSSEHRLYEKDFKYRIGVSAVGKMNQELFKSMNLSFNRYDEDQYNNLFSTTIEGNSRIDRINKDLDKALRENQFVLYCQPIVDIVSKSFESAEILIRWEHPELGFVMPGEFIGLAENSGKIKNIDKWVLKNSLEYIKENIGLIGDMKVHINLSSKSFESKDIFNILDSYKEYGVLKSVVLEITEESNAEILTETFLLINSLGISFAIDDFGTGFSSFERLRKTGVDFVKIDKSLVDNITQNAEDVIILKAIINMCENLDLGIIVEGVTSTEQIEFFSAYNCSFIQGYYFYKPFPLDQLIKSKNVSLGEISKQLDFLDKTNIFERKFYNKGRVFLQYMSFDFEVLHPNLELASALGYTINSLDDINLERIVNENDWNYLKSAVEQIQEIDEIISFSTSIKKYSGEAQEVLCAIKRDGNKVQIYIEFDDDLIKESNLIGLSQSYIETFHKAPVGILILNHDYRVERFNEISKELLNINFTNSTKHNLLKVFSGDFEKLNALLSQAKISGVSRGTIEVFNESGGVTILSIIVNLVNYKYASNERYICIIQDITGQKRLEEERNKINTALEQSKSVIVMTNLDGNIEYVNEAFEMTTGYLRDEVIGQNTRILKSGYQSDDYYARLWQTLDSGQAWNGDFQNKKKDGNYYWCHASIYPVYKKEKVTGFMGIQQDITHEKELLDANEVLKNKLIEQDKTASLGLLTSGIMHEINNPLAYIDGNVSYLASSLDTISKASDEELLDFKEAFQDIIEGIEQIKNISNGLKKYIYKQEEDIKTYFSVIETIKEVVLISRNEYKYVAEINLEYDFEDTYTMIGYPSKLKQVFLNLIINATYAIERQAYEALGVITINISKHDNYLKITFKDNGIGMTNTTLDSIFTPFYTTKKKGVGSGLGLSVSKQIIEEEHDGQIKCSSKLSRGTTFELLIPQGNV